MKKLTYLALGLLLMSVTCDDDEPGLFTYDPALVGEWNMTQYNVSGSEQPVLEPGDVIWTFSNERERLIIDSNDAQTYPFMPATGEYFLFNDSGVLRIQPIRESFQLSYRYTITEDSDRMTLVFEEDPDLADDEVVIQFEK